MTDLPDSRTLLDMQPSVIDAMRKTQVDSEALYAAIRRDAHETVRAICSRHVSQTDVARRMMRIEITHDVESTLLSGEWARRLYAGDPRGREGPLKLDGVDTYVVRQLPEPGWRVINPFVRPA